MEFHYNEALMRRAVQDLERAAKEGARKAMQKAMRQAERDARALAFHRYPPGKMEQEYGEHVWEWERTGRAAVSIQGYVVPDKNLKDYATRWSASYFDGQLKRHPHYTDSSQTETYSEEPDTVIGIITMNVNYAPYLQDYEAGRNSGDPITVEVLKFNWDRVYVPLARREMEQHIAQTARKYT